ncbi:MAG: hypothetical protein KF870_02320 [Leadbetterella sp.]|nr:hypothetical protein [Leadbetterella sp.]
MSSLDVLLWLGKVASFFSVIPLILALFKYKAFLRKPNVFLLAYFLAGALLNWGTSWFVDFATKNYEKARPFLEKFEISNTFFVDPLYFLKNFILLGAYTYYLVDNKALKRNILILSVTGILFTVMNSLYGETYKEYQSWGSVADNLYKVFIGSVLIRYIFYTRLDKPLLRIPQTYFATAILLVALVAGLIDFLSNEMFSDHTSDWFYRVHIVKNLFMIGAFLLFTTGVYYTRK